MSVDPPAAARSPNPVFAALGRALEAGLDRLVDLDPDTRQRLRALDGRAVQIDFKGALPAMRIVIEGARLRIGPGFGGDSALRVAASPSALLALALARGSDAPLAPGRVEIAGDADLARQLERIATRFAPDFDEAFARVFGDVAGHAIARALRNAFAAARRGAHALAKDTAEFLTEESRDVVAAGELDLFIDDVDALRERADRLAARVRRLREHHGPRGA